MKLWASASAIGLSIAYFATACSSTAPDDNVCTTCGTAGSGTAGSTGTPTAGTSTGGTPAAGGTPGTGGVPTTAGTAGTPAAGGMGGGTSAGSGGGGAGGGGGGKVACPANVLGHCSEATYPAVPGYTLALVEDFPEPLDLDKDPIWTWSDGSPADGQTSFRKEQITFTPGHMVITAEAPAGCAAKTTNAACIAPGRMSYGEALSPNKQATLGAMGVWSGELRTKYNNYRYGHYEVKYSAPIANPGQENTDTMSGDFLSTMFIFRTPKNVKWNEIDIELEPNHHDKVAGNMVNATGATGYPGGNALPFVANTPAGYNISQEHVYAFNWTPTKVDWFLDGQLINSTTGSAADPIPNLSAKIMMNLWIFSGDAFGAGVNNKFPFHATYDYFRFYKLDGADEAKYPCPTPPACLDAADKTVSAQNNPNEMNYGM